MPKISIGTWAFAFDESIDWSLEQIIPMISKIGYEGVEIGAFAPHPTPVTAATTADRSAIAELVKSNGLEISGAAASASGTRFLDTADDSEYLKVQERNIRFAADLGTDRYIINTGHNPETPFEVGEEIAFEKLFRTWDKLGEFANRLGVKLVWEFEPCWAFNEPEQILRIADYFDPEVIGVLYDTAHAHTVAVEGARHVREGRTLVGGQADLLRELGSRITHVHLLDTDGSISESDVSAFRTTIHRPFGSGAIDFDALAPTLRDVAGGLEWWTVDLCFCPDPWEEAGRSLAFVKRILSKE